MNNKLGRAIRIEMPSELIPLYDLLNWVYNSILNNPTFISQLKQVDYSKHRGKVRDNLHKILGPYIYSKINSLPVKSWYARTIYEQLTRLFRKYNTDTTCYNAVANVKRITGKILKDLQGQNIYTTLGHLRNLKDAGRPPELPTNARFVLDLSISNENCLRDIKDNTKITIRYAKNKALKLDYALPKRIFAIILMVMLVSRDSIWTSTATIWEP